VITSHTFNSAWNPQGTKKPFSSSADLPLQHVKPPQVQRYHHVLAPVHACCNGIDADLSSDPDVDLLFTCDAEGACSA
jgi:hypothetical protein